VATVEDPPTQDLHSPNPDDDWSGPPDTATSAASTAAGDVPPDAASELLGLTVTHPAGGVCVVTVAGELDMYTTPLLETCLQDQLRTRPDHLVVDLQPLSFLASHGLNCLVQARENTQHTATQLHLAGLVTRAVARPLEISQLRELFDTYPTVTEALTAILQ
jgi:anti-sigma B factor antagonist